MGTDRPVTVSTIDAAIMIALGAGQAATATILIVLAARHARAAEVNPVVGLTTAQESPARA